MNNTRLRGALYFLKHLLFTGILLFLLVASINYSLYRLEKKEMENRSLKDAELAVTLYEKIIITHMESTLSDLLLLRNFNSFNNYLLSPSRENREFLEQDLKHLSLHKKVYDQIRFIDTTGMEKIRINYNDGNPAPAKLLQNKSSRYYFSETIKQNENTLTISRFDLNMEMGIVEVPLKPTIRFSLSVFSQGEIKGVLVINYLGTHILNELTSINIPGEIIILNKKGEWVYSQDNKHAWSYMYPEKNISNFSQTHPETWAALKDEKSMTLLNNSGLFSAMQTNMIQSKKNGLYSNINLKLSESYWWLVHHTPLQILNEKTDEIFHKRFNVLMVMLLPIVLVSWVTTRAIVQRKAYQKALKKSALYDHLTDLPNRRLMLERLSSTLEQGGRYLFDFALMYLDLDGFKAINDTWGHDTGDEVLKEISQRLLNSLRKSDTAARLGGDEFIIILSRINSPEDCHILAEKLLDHLKEPILYKNNRITVGASIGCTICKPHTYSGTEEILKHADKAMYEVKKQGKNGFSLYREKN